MINKDSRPIFFAIQQHLSNGYLASGEFKFLALRGRPALLRR